MFQLPLLLQFMVLFFYCNKHINLHQRLLAMDKFADQLDQQQWLAVQSLRLYFFAFVFVIYLQQIYFTPFLMFVAFCSVWLPQIYKTTLDGGLNCPSAGFAAAITAHTVFVPLYFVGADGNMLFLKPRPWLFWFCVGWVVVQLAVLKIQQKKPRFLVPRGLRPYVFSGFYKYETTFSEAVDLISDGKSDSQTLQFLPENLRQDFQLLSEQDRRETKKEIRKSMLQREECAICID
jgi:hypothetical protein